MTEEQEEDPGRPGERLPDPGLRRRAFEERADSRRTVMLKGWLRAKGSSQLGMVATGTTAELANIRTKKGSTPGNLAELPAI